MWNRLSVLASGWRAVSFALNRTARTQPPVWNRGRRVGMREQNSRWQCLRTEICYFHSFPSMAFFCCHLTLSLGQFFHPTMCMYLKADKSVLILFVLSHTQASCMISESPYEYLLNDRKWIFLWPALWGVESMISHKYNIASHCCDAHVHVHTHMCTHTHLSENTQINENCKLTGEFLILNVISFLVLDDGAICTHQCKSF